MVKGLIVEGIAGAGKSTIVQKLQTHEGFLKYAPKISVFEEERTLGNLVVELRNAEMSDAGRCERIRSLLPSVETELARDRFVVLERFHHSYYALMPQWELVEQIDKWLANSAFVCAFLDYPPDIAEERFFYRPEMHENSWTESLEKWYGSKQAAVKACLESRANRLKTLEMTAIPTLKLDTQGKDWEIYCDRIVDFIVNQYQKRRRKITNLSLKKEKC